MMVLQLLFTDKLGSPFINPLNPKIKIKILICCPYSFPTEVVGRSWQNIKQIGLFALSDRVASGFYLGFIFWGRGPDWPKATSFLGRSRDKHPREFFEMNMHWDAIWCILRHNFEKCYTVCNDLVLSEWFFQYSYLYTVVITIFFWGKLRIFGGKLLPLKYPG